MTRELRTLARQVAAQLAEHQQLIVLAESCTGGLVAASLATVPGISNFLCGSAVTYQNATKESWLDVPAEILKNPGPVSKLTAQCMAEGALRKTSQASLAAAVTGHLGPNAPRRLDGVVYVAISQRNQNDHRTKVQRVVLPPATRLKRQQLAAATVLKLLHEHLSARD